MQVTTQTATGREPENAGFYERMQQEHRRELTSRRREAREATTKRQRIEQNLREDTVDLELAGEELAFRTFGVEDGKWVMTMEERWEDSSADEAFLDEFSDDIDHVIQLLGEHCTDSWATVAWFRQHLSLLQGLKLCVAIAREDESLTQERAESFR